MRRRLIMVLICSVASGCQSTTEAWHPVIYPPNITIHRDANQYMREVGLNPEDHNYTFCVDSEEVGWHRMEIREKLGDRTRWHVLEYNAANKRVKQFTYMSR